MRNRFSQLDRREYDVVTELQEIVNGDGAETIRIDGEEFDNKQWLFAELRETEIRRDLLEQFVSPEGGVVYDAEVAFEDWVDRADMAGESGPQIGAADEESVWASADAIRRSVADEEA